MEKYGAEIQKYEVIDNKAPGTRVVGTDLDMDQANELARESVDYIVRPL